MAKTRGDISLIFAWGAYQETKDLADLLGVIGNADFFGHDEIKNETIQILTEKLGLLGIRQNKRVEDYWVIRMFDVFMSQDGTNVSAVCRKIGRELNIEEGAVKKRLQRLGKVK